ncbi:unnamed protein product (macronuclear) [Paramecium tetraurelia]|uniref:Transmembrane protein n=1 Tax=Paramecium tetraurelia TaxID=5888 RepID=A0CY91_PARTE|nr:uncharacterized protein GSPATT00039096001 [Paramecium tetraurelia]CAK75758.1 unnamed protein product [Paramecium tetraurelia]|eukprot:XP_001443155.1 hypothetical protein (macronuclear) [Paramecium tetraurelia strain d4-2]
MKETNKHTKQICGQNIFYLLFYYEFLQERTGLKKYSYKQLDRTCLQQQQLYLYTQKVSIMMFKPYYQHHMDILQNNTYYFMIDNQEDKLIYRIEQFMCLCGWFKQRFNNFSNNSCKEYNTYEFLLKKLVLLIRDTMYTFKSQQERGLYENIRHPQFFSVCSIFYLVSKMVYIKLVLYLYRIKYSKFKLKDFSKLTLNFNSKNFSITLKNLYRCMQYYQRDN